jgi:hypothetical protein
MDKSEKQEALRQINREIDEVKTAIAAGDNSFENTELLALLRDEKRSILEDKIDEEEYND